MALHPRFLVSLAVVGAVAAVVVWNFRGGTGVPPVGSSSSASGSGVVAKPQPNADGLALERNHAAVFQRAFWRHASADERILHAERRDWIEGDRGVERWQWFIAVQPGVAFRDWLLRENPFELVVVSPDAAPTALASPPDWFPSAAELARFARYRNREGRYFVFYDVTANRLYATDSGGGFAAARK
jgi:hypothetical protein